MHALARENPRYGYRRIHRLLLRIDWRVNHKRVQRLWRIEGLKVPQKAKKRRSPGNSANSCLRKKAEYRNHVWSYDFVFDRTETGQRLKMLTMVDEYTRECLCLHMDRSITADDVIGLLAAIMIERGVPAYIRSDNGPEFVAEAIRAWLENMGSSTLFIAPGSPWENAYIESFNSRLRDELLNLEVFIGLPEARYLANRYRDGYNNHRPHSSIGYMTPAEFAASCSPSDSATLRLRANSSVSPTPPASAGITLQSQLQLS